MIARRLTRRKARPQRASFTLVELMVVIVILGILASTMLFALYGVMETAKEARTKAQIARLNEILLMHWEAYRTRPVPLRIPPGTPPPVAARMRLDALRELMRMELPDRITDVSDDPVSGIERTALSRAYQRRVAAAGGAWSAEHQGAECLYMIVASTRVGEGSALDFFKPSEIGDVDGDGMPEILDAWGNPIEFLRWAPGFRSEMQTGDPEADPDPFDPRGVYSGGFALYPLVFSAGPSMVYDILTDFPSPDGPLRYAATKPRNNPYVVDSNGNQIGAPMDVDGDGHENHGDNVTNHFIEVN